MPLLLLADNQLPIVVSEGDSWFQFPILLNDVIDQLNDDYLIWSLDAAGDTLQNMVIEHPEYIEALRQHSGNVHLFLFSGAGNDIVGEDSDGVPVLTKIVREFTSGQPAEWYYDTPEFSEKLKMISDCYRTVFSSVAAEFPSLPIVCHGYDYALAGGGDNEWRNPIYAAPDEWIGKPLRKKGIVDADLQYGIVKGLIDRLNERQRALCGGNCEGGEFANAYHVDVRGLLQPSEWADELHPTDAGFAKVAVVFRNVIASALQRFPGV